MSNHKKASFQWIIWPWWVLLSAVGGGVGFTLGFAAAGAASDVFGRPLFEAVMFGIFGTSVGALQWLVLRAHVTQASWWVLASAASWTLLGALANSVEATIGPAIIGAVIGALQWLVLQKHVHLAGFWIVASALGWSVGWFTAIAVDKVVAMIVSSETMGYAVLYAVMAAVAGAFTGLALIWLLRHPILKSELEKAPPKAW